MKVYVYYIPTDYISVVIQGNGHTDIVKEFEQQNWDEDYFGLSFTDFGLVSTNNTQFINTPEFEL